MKVLVFVSQVLLLMGLVSLYPAFNGFAQHKPYNTFDKDAELNKFMEQGVKVEEISPNIYRLVYRSGESRIFNLKKTACPYSYSGITLFLSFLSI